MQLVLADNLRQVVSICIPLGGVLMFLVVVSKIGPKAMYEGFIVIALANSK